MGMDPATLALLGEVGAKVGSSALSSAFAPSPFQPRKSFAGGTADPTAALTSILNSLKSASGAQATWASTPPNLSDAVVQDLPSFNGGGLPMPIGVSAKVGALGAPQRLSAPNFTGAALGPAAMTPSETTLSPITGTVTGNPGDPVTDPPAGVKTNPNPMAEASPAMRLAYSPPDLGNGSAPSGNSAPGGLDPQTYGAIQLLMHAVKGTGN